MVARKLIVMDGFGVSLWVDGERGSDDGGGASDDMKDLWKWRGISSHARWMPRYVRAPFLFLG